MSKSDLTALNKAEEEKLMKYLFDFVCRVSSLDRQKYPEEVMILPEMTKILIRHFVEPYSPSTEQDN